MPLAAPDATFHVSLATIDGSSVAEPEQEDESMPLAAPDATFHVSLATIDGSSVAEPEQEDESMPLAAPDATFHVSLATIDGSSVAEPEQEDESMPLAAPDATFHISMATLDGSAVAEPEQEGESMSTTDEPSFYADGSYAIPDPVQEMSIQEEAIEDVPVQQEVPQPDYQIIESGTKRGKKKLIDRRGYQYTLRRTKGDNYAYWRCNKRAKEQPCPATVIQHGDDFKEGGKNHNHPAEPGIHLAVEITSKVKQSASLNIFTQSAPRIVEEVIAETGDVEAPAASRPKPSNLIRIVNRARLNMRPKDPRDLNFELDQDFLESQMPGFKTLDVYTSGHRHLIVYTQQQLDLLSQARTWYMDGTFHVVNHPWTQLFTIHSFIRSGQHMKQVPLVFCFMSRKRKEDYYQILRAIDRLLPGEISLQGFVVDFESAVWGAIQDRFPWAVIQGCVFHWTQALYRKVQELGLQRAYNEKGDVHRFLRQVMALPFLPPEHIEPVFHQLDQRARTNELAAFMGYVWRQWFQSSTFGVRNWSVFMASVRTNNDLEGWHNRINSRMNSRGPVPFYLLLQELYKEATAIPMQARLLTEGKLERLHRKQATRLNGKLFQLWEHYNNGDISTTKLLRKCSELYGPVDM
ncbi:uncharacterized protein LOC144622949 isoform X1 [Crassostrea virginica]